MVFKEAEECGVDALVSLETGGNPTFPNPSPAANADTFATVVPPIVQHQPSKPKRKKSKKNKRNKPKKAMTPFMVFSKETRGLLVQENPSMTFSEIGKELGARWRSLTDDDKVIYVEKAKEDYVRFLAESEQMDAQFPGKRRKTVAQKNQTKKKKSISAYLYFCNAHREQVKACHPEMKMVEIQRLLAEKWKSSSKTLKLPFEKQAEADREKYNSEIRKTELTDIHSESPNLYFNPISDIGGDFAILRASDPLIGGVKAEPTSLKHESPINFLHQ